MKRHLLPLVAVLAMACPAYAQVTDTPATEQTSATQIDSLRQEVAMLKSENEQRRTDEKTKSIWKRTKFFDIAFVSSHIKPEDGLEKDSKFGVALNLGNTYFLHRKPLAGMVKIGLDAIWADINYVNYDKGSFSFSNLPSMSDYDDYNDFDYDEEDFELGSLGWHKLDIGMGVGPSVHVAPFTSFSNGLEHLRAQLYFHFTPSFSALIVSDDNETKAHYGFSPVFNFGGVISYKMIAIGVEGRWCSAKYKNLSFDDEDEDEFGEMVPENNGKTKFKTSSVRAFIRFCY